MEQETFPGEGGIGTEIRIMSKFSTIVRPKEVIPEGEKAGTYKCTGDTP